MARQKTKSKTVAVADWMSTGVLAVETFDSIAIARQVMAKHRVNQLPVLDNDRLIGIVTDRDIRDAYPTSMMINHTEAIDQFARRCRQHLGRRSEVAEARGVIVHEQQAAALVLDRDPGRDALQNRPQVGRQEGRPEHRSSCLRHDRRGELFRCSHRFLVHWVLV